MAVTHIEQTAPIASQNLLARRRLQKPRVEARLHGAHTRTDARVFA